MSDDPTPPPPDMDSLPTGGIYVRWRDQLWQEQPDGSYFVWDEATRQWKPSQLQPPSDTGQTITTRECPNCGKRVKSSLRSCPYCEYGFEVPAAKQEAPLSQTTVARRPSALGPKLSAGSLLVGVALIAAIALVVFLKVRSDACENWKAGVRTHTQLAIAAEGLPRGMSEEEFRELNAERFANTRPGGCE